MKSDMTIKLTNRQLLEINIMLFMLLLVIVVWDIALNISSNRDIAQNQEDMALWIDDIARQLEIDLNY